MEYRKWRYEDVFQIAALEKECFSDPWSFQMLADTFFSEHTLSVAAAENGKIAGYAFAVLAEEEADLANIAVTKSFRHRGIAKELLSRLEAQVRAAGGAARDSSPTPSAAGWRSNCCRRTRRFSKKPFLRVARGSRPGAGFPIIAGYARTAR